VGNPQVSVPTSQAVHRQANDHDPKEVGVLIVGCEPARLALTAQLAAFPAITTCIIDQKPGRSWRDKRMAARAVR